MNQIIARSLLVALLCCGFPACQQRRGADPAAGAVVVEKLADDLVGEWSSARRGDSEGETIIFARDRSVVLRDGNYILRTSVPVPSGGHIGYVVDDSSEPAHLDFVITNSAREEVARIPGIVKVLTDDQVQVCMDPETLTRPADFNGSNCIVLTKLSGSSPPVQERIIVQQPVYTLPPSSAPARSYTIAYINSPGDGFLALRSKPSIRTGKRLARIPHRARVEVHDCQSFNSMVGSTRGQWCRVGYNGQYGWVFDAYLLRQ